MIKVFFLHTSLHRKPTERNTILHAKGFHPLCLTENGQFQRARRICHRDEVFEITSKKMLSRFVERGYKYTTHQRPLLERKTQRGLYYLIEM